MKTLSQEDFGKICRGMGAVSDILHDFDNGSSDKVITCGLASSSDDIQAMLQFVVLALAETMKDHPE